MKTSREERILSIDYGERRIGIAITDPLKIIALPLTSLANDKNLWRSIKNIFDDYYISEIVLGYPLKENGEKSKLTGLVEKFKIELEKITDAKIVFLDERYTSKIASQRILESVKSKKKRQEKKRIDEQAALILLQDYLNRRK